jgi:mannosyltransferase
VGFHVPLAGGGGTATLTRPLADGAVSEERRSRLALLAVAGLTAIAFALRVVGIDQSLFGDEYFTYAIVTGNGLAGVWDQVYNTSITPPLSYGFAWLAVQFGGDGTVLVRLPSLLFGTALVPLIFVLGRRVGGLQAGLFAALIIALSPFAIFYSTEARTYELLVVLVVLSMLALVRITAGGDRRWWVLYVVSSCGALWAHYTAVFVLAGGALWAIWAYRARWRELVIAQVVVAVGYLPWLPGFLEQRQNDDGIAIISLFSSVTIGRVFELPLRAVVGHPFLGLDEVPGTAGLLLALVVAALTLLAVVVRPAALRELVLPLRSPRGLVLVSAFATPVGLLLYDVGGPTLYGSRNLSASLPGLVLLIALLLATVTAALPVRLRAGAWVAVAAILGIVAIQSIADEKQRPPYREVAQYLDDVAGNDAILEAPLDAGLDARLGRSALEVYFERSHRLYRVGADDAVAWARVGRGESVYEVLPLPARKAVADVLEGLERAPAGLLKRQARLGGVDGRARLRSSRTFAGLIPVTVLRYQGSVDGTLDQRGEEERISWSLGKDITVGASAADGVVDGAMVNEESVTLVGWALNPTHERLVDWILCFSGDRLVAVSPGGRIRTNVVEAFGRGALLAGFSLSWMGPPPDPSSLRVFAVVGKRASELEFSKGVVRSLSSG